MDICLVCLRTDRRIKLNKEIAEIHDELCGFTLFITNTSYCGECEYLLTKFYKFKQKCEKASEIYRDWVSGAIKDPIHALHSLLPPSSLGVWLPNPKTVANINLEEAVPQPNFEEIRVNSTSKEFIKSSYITEIKLEYDPTNSNESICDDIQNEIMEIVPKYNGDDEKKNCLVTEVCFMEKIKLLKNNFKCEELLGNNDINNRNNTKNEEEPKDSKTSKVTFNKIESKTSKKRKRICNKKRQESLYFEIISKTNTKNEKEPKDSKINKVPCNKKEPIARKRSKVTINRRTSKKAVLEDDSLREDLVLKLSSFGEMETEDGTTVDRDLISKFLQHDVDAPVVRRLREAKCREDILDLSSDIEAALTTINNDWTNDDKPDYKSMYDIEYLSTLEKKLEEFQKRKTYEHYVKAKHKCEVCYQPFRGPIALDSHKQTYHDDSAGDQFCPICKMRVSFNCRNRNRHAETHIAVYKCKLCPLVTYYRNTMKEHAEKHRGKTYPCESCNVTYNCTSKYYSHMATYHRRGRIVCATCGRGFPSEKSLQVHTSITHRDAPPTAVGTGVRCEECDVTLPSQSVYEAHIRDVHEPPPPPEVFTRMLPQRDNCSLPKTNNKIKKEKIIELNPKGRKQRSRKKQMPWKHKCRVCNTVGVGYGWLQLHFKREHPNEDMNVLYADTRTHLCDICGAGFTKNPALRDHMNIHSGVKPHACDICPKQFRTRSLLAVHRLRHFPSTIPCPHCGKKFKTRANLYSHVKGHTGERSYNCDICGKGFLLSSSLNEHVRGVHHNIRRAKKTVTLTEARGEKLRGERKKVVQIDAIETNKADELETINTNEIFVAETIDTSEIFEAKTIDTSEIFEAKTIDTSEIFEAKTIDTSEIFKA